MNEIELAGLRFGQGLPKLCVPLSGSGLPELLEELRQAESLPADLYEWRMDGFSGGLAATLEALGRELHGRPLLCTLRTAAEGGKEDVSPEDYEKRLLELLDLGGFQLLDVELSAGEERVRRLAAAAKGRGVGVVVSRHDFQKTPGEEELFRTLLRMKELGADLPKLAVTPRVPRDVLTLLSATLRAKETIGPVITMAMGPLGKLSRVSGEVFGSCLTFGAGRSASAPGQLEAGKLRAILEDVSPCFGREEGTR